MLKQTSIFSLIVSLAVGLPSLTPSARADSAVVEDRDGNLFANSSSRINAAAAGAVAACMNRGNGGCELRGTAPNTWGWSAITKNEGRVHWVYGYNTRGAAVRAALNECSSSNNCRVVLTYFDGTP